MRACMQDVVRTEGRGSGKRGGGRGKQQTELYHSLQNHGILLSCGQICYILTLFESSLRYLITQGLTTVLRHELELEHQPARRGEDAKARLFIVAGYQH